MNTRRPSPLGRLVRKRREAAGRSLRDLARYLGVSATQLSDVETGRRRPSDHLLGCIMLALDVTSEQERDTWNAAAGVLPETLVETLLAHPERWGDVRALLTGGGHG